MRNVRVAGQTRRKQYYMELLDICMSIKRARDLQQSLKWVHFSQSCSIPTCQSSVPSHVTPILCSSVVNASRLEWDCTDVDLDLDQPAKECWVLLCCLRHAQDAGEYGEAILLCVQCFQGVDALRELKV